MSRFRSASFRYLPIKLIASFTIRSRFSCFTIYDGINTLVGCKNFGFLTAFSTTCWCIFSRDPIERNLGSFFVFADCSCSFIRNASSVYNSRRVAHIVFFCIFYLRIILGLMVQWQKTFTMDQYMCGCNIYAQRLGTLFCLKNNIHATWINVLA